MAPDWRIPYAISAAGVLTGLLLGLQTLYVAAKPLLMITLLIHFTLSSRGFPPWRRLVILALLFSWAGDVFLISGDWFVAGLASFLLAHVFYIIAYQKTGAAGSGLRTQDITVFATYGAALIWVVYAGLGDLKAPVLLYALVLLAMGVWALKRRNGTNETSFRLVTAGAVLFVLSDSLIAVNKFAFAIPAERILVMSIYMTAQYLIVQGLIQHRERT